MDEKAVPGPERESESCDNSSSPKPLFSLPYPGKRDSTTGTFPHTMPPVWLTKPVEETFERISEAMQCQSDLVQNLLSLRAATNTDTVARDAALVQCEKDAVEVQSFLTSCLKSIPVTMRPTAKSASKAEQVFNTAELLEAILIKLDPHDLLPALQVNRMASKMVSTTPKLQDILHLRPAKNENLSTIFRCDCGGPLCDLAVTYQEAVCRHGPMSPEEDEDLDPNPIIDVLATFNMPRNPPKFGGLCRRMLICQPPVKVMTAYTDCCTCWPASRRGPSPEYFVNSQSLDYANSDDLLTVTSNTGLTLGDLYDATVKLRNEHTHCPHADGHQHRLDGTVIVGVHFKGKLEAKKDDPYLVSKIKRKTKRSLSELDRNTKRRKLDIYVHTNRMAFRKGWAIPSLEEFEAENADGISEESY